MKRLVDCRFWDDLYIRSLDANGKYLFLYLLTNPLSNVAGIYESTLQRMAFDTELEPAVVSKYINQFHADKRIFYYEGFVILKNAVKHQATSPQIQKGIQKIIEKLPPPVRTFVEKLGSREFEPEPMTVVEKEKYVVKGFDEVKRYAKKVGKEPVEVMSGELHVSKDSDFMEVIIGLFKDEYEREFKREYLSVGKNGLSAGKDRTAASILLRIMKQKFPDENTLQMRYRFKVFFAHCMKIKDTWMRNNMSMSLLSSKINEIINTVSYEAIGGNSSPKGKGFDPRSNSWVDGTEASDIQPA